MNSCRVLSVPAPASHGWVPRGGRATAAGRATGGPPTAPRVRPAGRIRVTTYDWPESLSPLRPAVRPPGSGWGHNKGRARCRPRPAGAGKVLQRTHVPSREPRSADRRVDAARHAAARHARRAGTFFPSESARGVRCSRRARRGGVNAGDRRNPGRPRGEHESTSADQRQTRSDGMREAESVAGGGVYVTFRWGKHKRESPLDPWPG